MVTRTELINSLSRVKFLKFEYRGELLRGNNMGGGCFFVMGGKNMGGINSGGRDKFNKCEALQIYSNRCSVVVSWP